ncbi:MAG: hypothetical protein JNL08_06800 [Planctomycetes bacterium]|nr:hypothetical protein [Planctomycetota bacterium]
MPPHPFVIAEAPTDAPLRRCTRAAAVAALTAAAAAGRETAMASASDLLLATTTPDPDETRPRSETTRRPGL